MQKALPPTAELCYVPIALLPFQSTTNIRKGGRA